VPILASMTSLSAQELTVWDFKSADPVVAPYIASARKDFEAKHPGVTVKHVMQPHDRFYTILGTAISAGQGPDVVLLHGGAQTTSRADALVPLTDAVADIKSDVYGWDSFTAGDGRVLAVPITLQGYAMYFNKTIYREAGLDPDKPPQTWDELAAACKAILERTSVDCIVVGNKSGSMGAAYYATLALGMWTPADHARFLSGEMSWEEPAARLPLESLEKMIKGGWFKKGANSLETFTDAINEFMRGSAANVLGLLSDIKNWKQFEDFMGQENVGVFMPVAVGTDPATQTHRLPVDGGIGFAVTRWTPHRDLAVDYVKTLVGPEHQRVFLDSAGALPASAKVDLEGVTSPGARQIFEWMACCSVAKRPNTFMPLDQSKELIRQTQLMFVGEATADSAVAALERVRTSQNR